MIEHIKTILHDFHEKVAVPAKAAIVLMLDILLVANNNFIDDLLNPFLDVISSVLGIVLTIVTILYVIKKRKAIKTDKHE